ncbi:uncharacterized protein ARMOST_11956 [Armillaria ostoyae]|uniref:Uncharacterized protein n=1 Tax=Armillaria ostoyae TaxID=47428 RepID=A0A284RIK3_ARMOS|nr:uncharacterized protein ARMOST_11956 [Armillaria ostoyae]
MSGGPVFLPRLVLHLYPNSRRQRRINAQQGRFWGPAQVALVDHRGFRKSTLSQVHVVDSDVSRGASDVGCSSGFAPQGLPGGGGGSLTGNLGEGLNTIFPSLSSTERIELITMTHYAVG